jgi:hypothetical protein
MAKYSSFKNNQLLMENFRRYAEGEDFTDEEEEGEEEVSCPVPPKTVEVNGESADTQKAAKVAEKVMGSDLLKKLLKNPEFKAALDDVAQEMEQKLKTLTKADISEIRKLHEASYGQKAPIKQASFGQQARIGRDEYPDWESAGRNATQAPIGSRPTHGAPKKKKPLGDMEVNLGAAGAMGAGCLVFMLLGFPGMAGLAVATGSALAASTIAYGATYVLGIAVGLAADYIIHKMRN